MAAISGEIKSSFTTIAKDIFTYIIGEWNGDYIIWSDEDYVWSDMGGIQSPTCLDNWLIVA